MTVQMRLRRKYRVGFRSTQRGGEATSAEEEQAQALRPSEDEAAASAEASPGSERQDRQGRDDEGCLRPTRDHLHEDVLGVSAAWRYAVIFTGNAAQAVASTAIEHPEWDLDEHKNLGCDQWTKEIPNE